MNNRLFALLILLWFGGAIYAFYLYFYVYYKWDLEISSHTANYQVVLYSDTVKRSFTQNCIIEKCLFTWLPPVEYNLTATASGYVDIITTVKIPKNDFVHINLNFEREIILKPLPTFTPALSPEQKVEAFTSKKLYKLVDNEAGVYYITKDDSEITLASESWNIGIFEFNWTKRDITIESVRWTHKVIWIKIWEKNYLYNLKYKNLSEIWVEQIDYIKKSWEYDFLIISTDALYTYTPNSNTLTPEGSKTDFVLYNDEIVSLSTRNWNSIIQTQKKILLERSTSFVQIYVQDNQIHLLDAKNNGYILQGLE